MRELPRVLGQVYVINLPSRTDRRDEMTLQLRRVGLDWSSQRVSRFDAVRPEAAEPFRTVGSHGCFRSHLGVLERAGREGRSTVLILEDDCNFVADAGERLHAMAAALERDDWSFFYGGCRVEGREPPTAAPGRPLVEMAPERNLWLAHCVAIRGEALRRLPAYLRAIMGRRPGDPAGGPMDVDGAYSWFRREHPQCRTLAAVPEIAYQRSSRTDISPLGWHDRVPVMRDIVRIGRRARNLIRS